MPNIQVVGSMGWVSSIHPATSGRVDMIYQLCTGTWDKFLEWLRKHGWDGKYKIEGAFIIYQYGNTPIAKIKVDPNWNTPTQMWINVEAKEIV